ncbi:MAG: type II toxin-antitoxin system RelE/ParE family toxin [Bacteroidetes bacterium]|nr:type II toxin-antitoxin system RelE/ParE family toxin [Bacteroidota bacterium]MBS1939834.1 type II toxin-antitoxin system RelE/ParE family toxin [Bacteroidota bacterium]
MKYRLRVRAIAVREFSAVAIWYERRSTGLGHRFLDELQDCFQHIALNPQGFQLREGAYRHALLDNFPYRVVYKIKDGEVFVYQVRHTSRKPNKRFGP